MSLNNLKKVSIIIPIASDETEWSKLVEQIFRSASDLEVLLVSTAQMEVVKPLSTHNVDFKVIRSEPGRAAQLNTGARHATREWLWFLHADSLLSEESFQILDRKIAEKNSKRTIWYFDLKFNSSLYSPMFINNIGVWLRSRLLKLPFGDQGFFLHKEVFNQLESYNTALPKAEDLDFIWRASHDGYKVKPIGTFIKTSERKYLENGWFYTTSRHVADTYLYLSKSYLRKFGGTK